jgi:hypothetical protein
VKDSVADATLKPRRQPTTPAAPASAALMPRFSIFAAYQCCHQTLTDAELSCRAIRARAFFEFRFLNRNLMARRSKPFILMSLQKCS